jgi:hypothetical protein
MKTPLLGVDAIQLNPDVESEGGSNGSSAGCESALPLHERETVAVKHEADVNEECAVVGAAK